jgi:NAD(P)-dependent dehydrogenase (short-subunit alcohol dehydrogenase family)
MKTMVITGGTDGIGRAVVVGAFAAALREVL